MVRWPAAPGEASVRAHEFCMQEGLLPCPVYQEVSLLSRKGAGSTWAVVAAEHLLWATLPAGLLAAGHTGWPAALSRDAGALHSTTCQPASNPSPPRPVCVQGDAGVGVGVGGRGLCLCQVLDIPVPRA